MVWLFLYLALHGIARNACLCVCVCVICVGNINIAGLQASSSVTGKSCTVRLQCQWPELLSEVPTHVSANINLTLPGSSDCFSHSTTTPIMTACWAKMLSVNITHIYTNNPLSLRKRTERIFLRLFFDEYFF